MVIRNTGGSVAGSTYKVIHPLYETIVLTLSFQILVILTLPFQQSTSGQFAHTRLAVRRIQAVSTLH